MGGHAMPYDGRDPRRGSRSGRCWGRRVPLRLSRNRPIRHRLGEHKVDVDAPAGCPREGDRLFAPFVRAACDLPTATASPSGELIGEGTSPTGEETKTSRVRTLPQPTAFTTFSSSGRRDLNPRRPPWQGPPVVASTRKARRVECSGVLAFVLQFSGTFRHVVRQVVGRGLD
jgi:hypothetical protein